MFCRNCELEKDILNFHKSDLKVCKECRSIKSKEYYNKNRENVKNKVKDYNLLNKEKIDNYQSKYRESNIEKSKEYNKIYYLENKDIILSNVSEYNINNKDKVAKYKKEYSINNREYINSYFVDYISKRKKNDNVFRLTISIRCLINKSFRVTKYSKKSKTSDILGCSFKEFRLYIESKFEDWMTWDNYGLYNGELNYGWDIDHIIPLSSVNTEDDIIKLNHYTNLQPLCSYTNRVIKKDNIITT